MQFMLAPAEGYENYSRVLYNSEIIMMALFKYVESEIFTTTICCDWLANGRAAWG